MVCECEQIPIILAWRDDDAYVSCYVRMCILHHIKPTIVQEDYLSDLSAVTAVVQEVLGDRDRDRETLSYL